MHPSSVTLQRSHASGGANVQSSFDSDPVNEFVFSGSIYPLLRANDAQGSIWVVWRRVCLDFGGVKIPPKKREKLIKPSVPGARRAGELQTRVRVWS